MKNCRCGGDDVLRSGDAGARIALTPRSGNIVLFDRNVDLKMLNHRISTVPSTWARWPTCGAADSRKCDSASRLS
ncbi:hypothetical protein NX784_02455 [Massilia pinisoli]|uniref:Uncharacterized protein n=1 Tax=Massilia pinisoli TaxID=1772194 RepID=A0ABT1ZKL3_9BURK|nr:hypothetical protein [Massilia pinisoli]MCS0580441.1 hypothetical protein [Massilia pinisoli]